jgi:hypothetical protein
LLFFLLMPFEPLTDSSSLLLLLQAPNPQLIGQIFCSAYRCRNEQSLPQRRVSEWAQALSITEDQMRAVAKECVVVARHVVYHAQSKEDILAMFSSSFHDDMRRLIVKIVLKNLTEWKASATANVVSAPKLLDVDWRVDVKTSSNLLAHMSAPTVFVNMTVQQQTQHREEMPAQKSVLFELDQQQLDTMLDGLKKIQDQLGSIATQ